MEPLTILTSRTAVLPAANIDTDQIIPARFLTTTTRVGLGARLFADWPYDAVSIGYPGPVVNGKPQLEPRNLAPGWVGFDFADRFGKPVKILNDAAMQALGSYEGGRMLFLGLGTGLGSALIAENAILPLELGQLPHKSGETLGHVLGRKGLEAVGKEAWIEAVMEALTYLTVAFTVDYVVLGGGNAKKLKGLIPGIRMGHNLTAFRGGLRLWNIEDVPTLAAEGDHSAPPRPASDWRRPAAG